MKVLISLLSFFSLLSGCSNQKKLQKKKSDFIEYKKFQEILNRAGVDGSILVLKTNDNVYYSNDFSKAKEAYLPASTYKIPNSIIGLETGLLKDEKTVFKWNGEERGMNIWEQDLTLKQAFQRSCVPCYQELATNIGVEKMNTFLKKLNFGEMDVNSETLDTFWLVGNSKISPFEQIHFLNRLYNGELPVKKSTNQIVKNIMKIESGNGYVLSGKTGLAISGEKDVGWFVGFVEKAENVYFFATKITPKEKIERSDFIPLRKTITKLALKELNIIND